MKKYLGLFILSLAGIAMVLSCGPSKEVISAKNSEVHKSEKIKAGEYYQFEILLEDNMNAIALEGDWRVSEGGDRKAKVFIMDEENFLKFEKEEAYKSLYTSGDKINHDFKIRLLNQYKSAKTLYYLVFDNPSEDEDIKIDFNLKMDFEFGEGTK
jgi:hypothetical protein